MARTHTAHEPSSSVRPIPASSPSSGTALSVQYMSTAGATPKLIASANESICTPKLLVALSKRATMPSMRSTSTAQTMSHPASAKRPSKLATIDNSPNRIPAEVTRFGAM